MARWRLTASHYLHLDEVSEWEYTEIDRTNGKQKRKKFIVPTYLDIGDPSMWTEKILGMDGKPVDGYINVTNGTDSEKGDLLFKGNPTPDMEPLDDEATAITNKFKATWKMGNDVEPGMYAQNLIDNFQQQLADIQVAMKPQTLEIPGFAEFMKAQLEIQTQMATVLAALATKPAEAGRRA